MMRDKSTYVQVVPWRSREDWLKVYDKLYSHESDDLEWAINQTSIWQARCPTSSLLGVETTAGLIKARLLDLRQASEDETSNRRNEVAMVYAMALVRFVNLVCETGKSRAHVTPIRNIARGMGIPEWLINLRHSATHRYSIPSLEMLRPGSSLALEWLRQNYWECEKEAHSDVIQTGKTQSSVMEKIENGIQEFQNVHYAVLYGQNKKLVKMSRANLLTVLGGLRKLIKKHPYTFIHILSESGYLIAKYNHLEALLKPGEKDFLNSNSIQLPLSLEKFWSPIFALFSHNDHLQCLIKFLLEPHEGNDFTERLASAWTLHILNIISSQECGIFNFKTSLNWMQLLEIALKKPNQYSPQVLTAICENISMNEDTKQALMALVSIYLGIVPGTAIPKKFNMCSMDDVMKLLPRRDNKLMGTGPWNVYSGKCEWQTMPIGFVIQSSKHVSVSGNNEPDEFIVKDENECEPIDSEPQEMMENESEGYLEETKTDQTVLKEIDISSSLIFV